MAKTNRYEIVLSIFVSIDNNFKMRILVQALIKYKIFANYNWILQKTLEATNNLLPIVLLMDSNPAMLATIQLVKIVEYELDKELQYTHLNNYYGSNLSTGLPSNYTTIFKNIDSVLKKYLSSISLSLQRTQMKQALLYQELLITIYQIKEPENNFDNTVKQMYDMSQVRLQELLSNIDSNEVQEIWEINYILNIGISESSSNLKNNEQHSL
ncbi:30397_t:CDS:2, partial [Gigaspora margarita]